jgi:hypothetical protein
MKGSSARAARFFLALGLDPLLAEDAQTAV